MPLTNKMAHLFHWPSYREYQQKLLQVIALPIGARGELSYRDKWLNKTFADEIENINKSGGFDAIFWVLSNTETEKDSKVITTFDFICPIRLVHILNVDAMGDSKYINFIAQEFLSDFQKIDKRHDLKVYMKVEFGSPRIPYPGKEKGFAYIGPKIDDLQTTKNLHLESLYGILENIPCARGFTDGITIKDYPLVEIKTIEKCKVNESGLYKLSLNQEYNIILSCYQGERNRDRIIYINGKRLVGKSIIDKITILETRKSQDKINIEVKFNKLDFLIPLNVAVEIPWYKRAFTALSILFAISALSYFLFVKFLPSSPIEIRLAVLVPLIVLFVNKIFEVITKKD